MPFLPRIVSLVALVFAFLSPLAFAGPLTPGNVVVYRVGDGVGTLLNTGAKVFIDEYTTTGTLVQSIELESVTSPRLIANGTATSEGFFTRSTDGTHLVLVGYDAPIPTASLSGTAATATHRVVARLNANGTVTFINELTDYASGNNPRAVASDGTSVWVASGIQGLRRAAIGSTTSTLISTTVANLRAVVIAGTPPQLYVSTASGSAVRIGTVGTGLPTTTGQAMVNLPGLSPNTGSPNAFAFADLSGADGVVDTLYVADDGAAGITKYSLVAGAWTSNGTVGVDADDYRGLTLRVIGGTVTLFATRNNSQLVKITDASGFNGSFSGTPATLLATAAGNTAFRAVALAPGDPPVLADLAVGVTAPTNAMLGTNYDYTITVSNAGLTTANSVAVNFTLPPGVTFVSASGNNGFTGVNNAGTVEFTGGTLAFESVATLTVTVNAPTVMTVTLPPGAALVDPASSIAEANEGNNASTTQRDTIVSVNAVTHVISAVQGSGTTSPVVGASVTIEGIVTGHYPNLSPAGFFMQEEDADADSDPATSEGIFVANATVVTSGDRVRVTGTVAESNALTQITAATVAILAMGQPLPTAAAITMPFTSLGDLERYESMRVSFAQTLTVSENFELARFGELLLSSGGRLFNPTRDVDPNDDPATGTTSTGFTNVGAVLTANNLAQRNQIRIDDGSNAQNPATIPFLDPVTNTLRSGSTVDGLAGILNFSFGTYRVLPQGTPTWTYAARPATPPAVGSANVKVGSFNVLNYFNGNGAGGGFPTSRGANTLAEFNRQRGKIIQAIHQLGADVVGLMEIENDGSGPASAIQDLVNGLNTLAGAGTWALIADPAGYASMIGGTDEIKTALIYKPAAVTPVGAAVAYSDVAFTSARAPVAQTFEGVGTGDKFTVIVNHFKSKGSGGTGDDADQNDGQGNFNASRRAQATALATFVTQIVSSTGDPDVLILGDLNAYEQEDPIDILRAAGLVTLVNDSYSYIFDGFTGSLDHAIGTASLSGKVTGAGKWHINADEPIVLDYNVEFKNTAGCTSSCTSPDFYAATPFRSSDHDPVLVGLALVPPVMPVLTVAKTGNGSGTVTGAIGAGPTIIDCGVDCTEAVTAGATVTLTATPAAGSAIAGWSYCSGTAAVCEVPVNAAMTVTVTFLSTNPPRLVNISTRGQVRTGNDVMIAGFIIGGPTPKTIVAIVSGPSLTAAGVPGALQNPTVSIVRASDGATIASNDNWQTQNNPADVAALQSSGFVPQHPLEPAIIMTLPAGAYTAVVQGLGGTGVALVALYEVDHPEVPLLNISTRAQVLGGSDVMIAGFIIQGDSTQDVVVTVAGPSLTAAGVPGALSNPTISIVRASDGVVIASNDDWQAQANAPDVATIQNFGFAPQNELEPAVYLRLAPGAYTAVVQGAGGRTGIGLVGVYRIQ